MERLFPPISDYFVIGDLQTAALVSGVGSIDWLCSPDFDSASLFGRLLDKSGGCLQINMPGFKITGKYLKDTAVVNFDVSRQNERLAISFFMVPLVIRDGANQQLVISVAGLAGRTEAVFRFQPKPNYASAKPAIQIDKGRLMMAIDGGSLVLYLPAEARITKTAGSFSVFVPVSRSEVKQIVLEYAPTNAQLSGPDGRSKDKTVKFWHQWVKKGAYVDFCRDNLVRSAITLKLMQYYPTGAIVAAPTTSLPEEIGGVRNWDYRYSWIRDATFSLYSFHVLGYDDEAERFFSFIQRVTENCAANAFNVSLMYDVRGGAVPAERILNNLSGYRGSRPVRDGNAAARQFQLDVYGSLIDAFYFASRRGLMDANRAVWKSLVMNLLKKIELQWQEPDHGIWEARIGRQNYTYSKVMAWVGADRAARLSRPLGFSAQDLQVCAGLSAKISRWIWQNCFDNGFLRRFPGSSAVDATNLLFVLLQFLDKHDPQTRSIIKNTVEQLGYNEIFLYRYLDDDGLPGAEGAFLLCSFWLVSALAIIEEVEPAARLFKRLERLMGGPGLLSEEVDPESYEYLGNYPQAFSHMGYIMSAFYLNKYAKRKGLNLEKLGRN